MANRKSIRSFSLKNLEELSSNKIENVFNCDDIINLLFLEDVESECKNIALMEVKKQVISLSLDEKVKDIFIFINSSGGSATDFLSLYDAIMFARNKFGKTVYTIVNGSAYSGAVIALQAGSERIAMPNSSLMVHGIQISTELATVASVEQFVKATRKTEQQIMKIFSLSTGMSIKEFRELMAEKGPDWYLTPYEARKYNLIDRVF